MTNQIKTRDSFIFYRSFFLATKHLNQAEKSQLFDAICSYALDNEIGELNGTAQGMFELIKPQLDANRKRFENGCVKKQKISKTEAKNKQTISKDKANVNVNVNVNDNLECKSQLDSFCDEMVISLKEILGRKLNRNIATSNWNKEIKLIVNNDLKIRGEQQAKQDLIRCIQAIENHYGKEYFPIIQSAKSLREKFIKIENYLERSPQAKKNKLDDEFLAMTRNNQGGF
jgi:hypothetical protein